MNEITVRPMTPEDWSAVAKIYLEGIATEHATFQTDCPPYTAWDASHTKECRLVVVDDGVLAGWAALHRVDPRWCYRGVAEISIYIGERFRGRGLGSQLLTALCQEAEEAGYWTLQSTVLQDNAASKGLHLKCGFRLVGRRERIARDCHGRWLDTFLMERRCFRLPETVTKPEKRAGTLCAAQSSRSFLSHFTLHKGGRKFSTVSWYKRRRVLIFFDTPCNS